MWALHLKAVEGYREGYGKVCTTSTQHRLDPDNISAYGRLSDYKKVPRSPCAIFHPLYRVALLQNNGDNNILRSDFNSSPANSIGRARYKVYLVRQ